MKKLNAIKAWAWGASLALLLVAGNAAWAQGIITVVPQTQTYYSLLAYDTIDFNLDINGDGTTDFILRSMDPGTSVGNAFLIAQGDNQIVTMNFYVAAVNSGETIGSSLAPVYQCGKGMIAIGTVAGLVGQGGYAENGNFAGLSSAYIGFDLVNNGLNYYGWMSVSSPINDAGIYGEIVSWAYQSMPNTSILVGAVPEPSTWALLAIGAATLFFRRKFP